MNKFLNILKDKILNNKETFVIVIFSLLCFFGVFTYHTHKLVAEVNYIAKEVNYNNSNLSSSNAQDALDEIYSINNGETFISNTYLIQFNTNGGNRIISKNVSKTNSTITLETPTYQNYNFSGWYSDSSFTNYVGKGSDTVNVTSDMTLFAKWDVVTYTATFNTSGGSTVNTQTVNAGSTFTKPSDPTKEGHRFMGWYEEGSTEVYDFSKPATKNIILNARWSANKYNVSFEPFGGTGSNLENRQYDFGTSITLPSVSKTNATFGGWYSDSNYSHLIGNANQSVVIQSDLTLYAKWTYRITINPNGGNISTTSIDVVHNTKYNFSSITGTKENSANSIEGFYKDSNYTTKVTDNDKITESMTLYARWNYNVVFKMKINDVGLDTTYKTFVIPEGNPVSKPSDPEPVKKAEKAYYFVSWIDMSNNTYYDFSVSVNSNINIFAKWRDVPRYRVNYIYMSNGGSTVSKEFEYFEENESINLSVTSSKDGYEFVGWSENPNSRDVISSKQMPKSKIDLHAVFKKTNAFTLTFASNNSKIVGNTSYSCDIWNNEQSCTVSVTAPTISREGYESVGFSPSGSNDVIAPSETKNIELSSNVTYNAITRKAISLTFMANGNTLSINNKTASNQESIDSSCYIYNDDKTCDLLTPTIHGSRNTPVVLGYTVEKDVTIESEIGSNSYITVDPNGHLINGKYIKRLYSLTTSSPETYKVTYTKNDLVKKISKEEDSCTTGIVYNGDPVDNSCTITLPSIVLVNPNNSVEWSDGEKKYSQDQVIKISSNKDFVTDVTIKKHIIIFDTNGGTTIPNQIVNDSEKVEMPENPKKIGYVFKDWYEDKTFKKKFDFNTKIISPMTLYARFSRNSSNKDTVKIKSSDTTGGSVLLEKGEFADQIDTYLQSEVTGDELIKISENFKDAINLYVYDTIFKSSDGSIIDATNQNITYRFKLPEGISKYDNIRMYRVLEEGFEDVSYNVVDNYLEFTATGTGRFAIVINSKIVLSSSNNNGITISINDDLKTKVHKFVAVLTTGSPKTSLVNQYFKNVRSAFIFNSNLYDSNNKKLKNIKNHIIYSVNMPKGMNSSDNIMIYEIKEGKKKEIKYEIEDNKIIFGTNSTGKYAIVDYLNVDEIKIHKKTSKLPFIIIFVILVSVGGFFGVRHIIKNKNKI